MFRKFTKLYMVLLLGLIVIGGVTFFISVEPSEDQEIKSEEMAMQKTPGYETMTAVAQIANTHLLENAILNIQVTPKDDKEDVLLQLQTTEFLTEDILLKNTYNLLQDIRKIETIDTFTVAWFALINSENTEVLTLTFNRQALEQAAKISYNELPSIVTDYRKHESLN